MREKRRERKRTIKEGKLSYIPVFDAHTLPSPPFPSPTHTHTHTLTHTHLASTSALESTNVFVTLVCP